MTTNCKCGRYLASDGKPCFHAPRYKHALYALRHWRVRHGLVRRTAVQRERAARIASNSRQCFMDGVLPSERRLTDDRG